MKTNELARVVRAVPEINVTPLIDVLLVLLIIFMVASPLKPSRFKTFIPQETPPQPNVHPHPLALIVSIDRDLNLSLNSMRDLGSVNDTGRLSAELSRVFQERKANHAYREGAAGMSDVPEEQRIERTVFIKAPRSVKYGVVARVIDGIKGAGAEPVGLQVDDLD